MKGEKPAAGKPKLGGRRKPPTATSEGSQGGRQPKSSEWYFDGEGEV